jgi:hypothetical protein
MSVWQLLLTRTAEETFDSWFVRIASTLLGSARLVVAGESHRLTEIEFYYHHPEHPDLFAHRDPIQLELGRWYFHRTGGTYRGGSFKGLDISFGDGTHHGGVLLRGLEQPDGSLVDGPSLLVDHLLKKSGYRDVSAFDKDIAERPIWDDSSPLILRHVPAENRCWLRCARVGLTLRRHRPNTQAERFVLKPYRFLTEPKRIAKGKIHMVLALHAQGQSAGEIQQMTGCPAKTLQRYIDDFERGRQTADFAPFYGIDLGPRDLCQLHGVWHILAQGDNDTG